VVLESFREVFSFPEERVYDLLFSHAWVLKMEWVRRFHEIARR
jgi:hypothetical protein